VDYSPDVIPLSKIGNGGKASDESSIWNCWGCRKSKPEEVVPPDEQLELALKDLFRLCGDKNVDTVDKASIVTTLSKSMELTTADRKLIHHDLD
jgi:hypothetical protein